MSYFYSLSKDGYFFIWKWVDDYLSAGYKNLRKFELFKKNKKLRLSKRTFGRK